MCGKSKRIVKNPGIARAREDAAEIIFLRSLRGIHRGIGTTKGMRDQESLAINVEPLRRQRVLIRIVIDDDFHGRGKITNDRIGKGLGRKSARVNPSVAEHQRHEKRQAEPRIRRRHIS